MAAGQTRRTCRFSKENGALCRAAPLTGEDLCFWHSPTTAQEAAEARRLGGLRRRREGTVAGAYDLEGLESVPQIRRVLEIATIDTLGLENSVSRNRALIAGAGAAAKLLETGELQARLEALEAAVRIRPATGFDAAFDAHDNDGSIAFVEGPQ
jgi:hypothetical protein